MVDLKGLLEYVVTHEGSDLYLTTAAPPSVKIHGKLCKIPDTIAFVNQEISDLAQTIMNDHQKEIFTQHSEMNLAISESGVGRFRVNIFQQRGEVGMVIRHIKTNIPHIEQLGLPTILKKLIMEKRGLILFVGATGSGKSTSLATLIDYRNKNSAGHIISIEDPIEYIHTHNQSIITQREVGFDTISYRDALKNTLRQAPDVILIGEVRSQDTMEYALTFSETGHLCLSTLHANNANQALERIINFFPEERHNQLLLDLSLNLKAIVSQRLIPTRDHKRVAAFEILINTPLVADLIRRRDILALKEIMQKSENTGMQTFDSALYKLYTERKICLEEALAHADSKNNLRLKVSLKEGVKGEKLDLSIAEDSDYV